MTNKSLLQLVLEVPTETRTIEFKRLGSRNEGLDKTLQSIVAMANTDGGIVVLGIDDPQKTTKQGIGRVYGIEENFELFDELGQAVKKIFPPISDLWPPKQVPVKAKNLHFALLFIPKVFDSLRSIENHVYIRGEKRNIRLSPQEIIHFAYVKGFQRADNELVEVNFDLLDTKFYNAWREKRSIRQGAINTVLEKTGLSRKNPKGKLLPTRAAVLLSLSFLMIY